MPWWISLILIPLLLWIVYDYVIKPAINKFNNTRKKKEIEENEKKEREQRNRKERIILRNGIWTSDRKTLSDLLQPLKEFKIYEKLWKDLVALQSSTAQLIPIVDIQDPGKSEEEIKKERLEKVQKAYIKVREAINDNKPFYDKKIYKYAIKILSKSFEQALVLRYPVRDVMEHYKKAGERTDEINEIIGKIEEVIRERILIIGRAKLTDKISK